jgi:alkylation response protein AidB-like acyl-CoA dehydrogenase
MFMLVRTDTDAPKHRGISFLLTEMDVPGITVERIPMMWDADRALVTLDKVRVPKKYLVGELNRGWYVGTALLDFERSGVGNSARGRRILEELVHFCKENSRNGRPLSEDPVIRSRLATMAVEIEACRMMSYNVAWMQSKELIPNKEASIVKAFGTEMIVRLYQLGMKILGLYGQLGPDSKWAPLKGRIENAYMVSAASMVAAGTSEIQRNIIATRGLGLPRG